MRQVDLPGDENGEYGQGASGGGKGDRLLHLPFHKRENHGDNF